MNEYNMNDYSLDKILLEENEYLKNEINLFKKDLKPARKDARHFYMEFDRVNSELLYPYVNEILQSYTYTI